ncbi:hypothetical protein Tco_0348078 [Tanacetum coccineum]
MGDANPIRTLGDYSKPSHEGYRNTIEPPKGTMWSRIVGKKIVRRLWRLGSILDTPGSLEERQVAPFDAVNWDSHMEKIFDLMDCNDAFKDQIGVYISSRCGVGWWRPYKQAKRREMCGSLLLTLDSFQRVVLLQFFPETVQERFEERVPFHPPKGRVKIVLSTCNVSSLGCSFLDSCLYAEESAEDFRWGLHSQSFIEMSCVIQFTEVAQGSDRRAVWVTTVTTINNKYSRDYTGICVLDDQRNRGRNLHPIYQLGFSQQYQGTSLRVLSPLFAPHVDVDSPGRVSSLLLRLLVSNGARLAFISGIARRYTGASSEPISKAHYRIGSRFELSRVEGQLQELLERMGFYCALSVSPWGICNDQGAKHFSKIVFTIWLSSVACERLGTFPELLFALRYGHYEFLSKEGTRGDLRLVLQIFDSEIICQVFKVEAITNGQDDVCDRKYGVFLGLAVITADCRGCFQRLALPLTNLMPKRYEVDSDYSDALRRVLGVVLTAAMGNYNPVKGNVLADALSRNSGMSSWHQGGRQSEGDGEILGNYSDIDKRQSLVFVDEDVPRSQANTFWLEWYERDVATFVQKCLNMSAGLRLNPNVQVVGERILGVLGDDFGVTNEKRSRRQESFLRMLRIVRRSYDDRHRRALEFQQE